MSARKLPEDSFSLYVALGAARSFDAVAKHFAVSKRTVSRAAEREEWTKRLEIIERKAREATDAKLADQLTEMNERHRKLLLAIAARAAAAIQQFPLEDGMQGIKAAEIAVKLERLLVNQPTETTALTVEKVSRDEVARLLTEESEDEEWADDEAEPPLET